MQKSSSFGTVIVIVAIIVLFRLGARIVNAAGSYLKPYGIPGWALGVVIVVVLLALGLRALKNGVVKSMPVKFDPIPTTPQEHTWLDRESLDRYTSSYESLGFTRLYDYTTRAQGSAGVSGFARLMVHPEQHCMAEVHQVTNAQGTRTPVRSVVMSMLADGWTLSTTDRKPEGTNWMLRRRKSVWSAHPDAQPAELFRIHFENRDKLTRGLGIQVVQNLSLDAYVLHEQEYQREMREIVQRRSMLIMLLEILLFSKNPKFEWWGNYRRHTS